MENEYILSIIKRIESGEALELSDDLKNTVNHVMAEQLQAGDMVEVIRTGMVGRVVKKIKYDRKGLYSPKGYTAVQVETPAGKYLYAGRSLRKVQS